MKKGNTRRRRGVSSKALLITLAVMLVIGGTIGGTLAWLTDKTAEVKNTFVSGDVDITLTETDIKKPNEGPKEGVQNAYKLVPGQTYTKDPTVTVKAGSEECYLFVKFEEKGDAAKYITYTSLLNADSGWTKLDNENNVWYRVVSAPTTDTSFKLLKDDKIIINGDTVTKDSMKTAESAELVYTAYACQTANIATAADAWDKVSAEAQKP